MQYKGKRVAITGSDGFLGSALKGTLELLGATVFIMPGDIRDKRTFSNLDHTFDILFHMAAPSSQTLFKRNTPYCIESTMKGFIYAAKACKEHGIRLVYPSTGLLSQDKYNEYALCKKMCEDYAKGLNFDSTGVRIFATYGPGEGHKADYASVPYLFARDMVQGIAPTIWGDGKQKRDFIYIEDVIGALVEIGLNPPQDPVVDVGSGKAVSFNEIIKEINKHMKNPVKAKYVELPANYVNETLADSSYEANITFAQGIKYLVESLEGFNKQIIQH